MFCVQLRRKCIPLLLDAISYTYQLSTSDLICHLKPLFPYWSSVWLIFHWWKWDVKDENATIVLLLTSCLMAVRFCLIHWDSMLGACVHAQLLQPCLTLCDSMDCRLPGSSPWDSPGKNTGVGCHAFLQGISPTQGSNLGLLHLLHFRWILYVELPGKHKLDTYMFSIYNLLLELTPWFLCSFLLCFLKQFILRSILSYGSIYMGLVFVSIQPVCVFWWNI